MREITGELWDYLGREAYCSGCLSPLMLDNPDCFKCDGPQLPTRVTTQFILCITTNGTVKANGECVMGRGCAAEAKARFNGIARVLGRHIQTSGNIPISLQYPSARIYTFPVKHNWFENADPTLIQGSAHWLALQALSHRDRVYILPRPGCGNGHLRWEDVRPVIAPILPDNVWVISR